MRQLPTPKAVGFLGERIVRNASNRDVNVTVWSSLSGNPSLSLSVRRADGSAYATVRLPVGGTLNLNLVLSASAGASSGSYGFTVGFDGVDEG